MQVSSLSLYRLCLARSILTRTLPRNSFACNSCAITVRNSREITTSSLYRNAIKFVNKKLNTSVVRCPYGVKTFTRGREYSSVKSASKDLGGQKRLQRFQVADGVPKSYTMIYRSDLHNYILASHLFLFITMGAVVTGIGVYFVGKQATEEEKQMTQMKRKLQLEEMRQKEKESRIVKAIDEFKLEHGYTDDAKGAAPGLEDFIEETNGLQLSIGLISFILLTISLIRLQRMLPLRIYTNDKKHCIAIMYGHILPGKVTWHEFLAGTVKPLRSKFYDSTDTPFYKDGSGKPLLLFERFFRSPADYNRVMGFIQDPVDFDDDGMRGDKVKRRK